MQNSSGDGNGQDSHHNQHYSLNFPTAPTSEPFYTNISSSSVSHIPGLLRLAPTSPMGMPSVSMPGGVQPPGASHGYTVPGSNPLKRTVQDAGFPDQRQCEMPSSDDDNSLSEKFSIPQTSVSPDGQPKTSEPSPTTKKTKGRVKIKMEFIDNKLRRYTTFSKRKTGIMKKLQSHITISGRQAYELSTLTGTQVMLLVASETGHVYTFATRKLQPMITSEAGKALIQTCLNSPDPSSSAGSGDQRMSATGFEETELCYNIGDDDQKEYEEDEAEEEDEEEDDSCRGVVKDSNGYLRRVGNASMSSPATAGHVSSPRTVGPTSMLVNTGSVVAAPVVTSSTQQLFTSQLLNQIKQQRHQLALHLAAGDGQPADASEPSRICTTPMSSLFQTPPGLLQLQEGLALLNSPSTVIQAVKSEHAGEPPNTAQPTDLSKSRVTNHIT